MKPIFTMYLTIYVKVGVNLTLCKGVLLQAWNDPECSSKLRFPDFVTTAQDGRRFSALHTSHLHPQEVLLVLISVRG